MTNSRLASDQFTYVGKHVVGTQPGSPDFDFSITHNTEKKRRRENFVMVIGTNTPGERKIMLKTARTF